MTLHAGTSVPHAATSVVVRLKTCSMQLNTKYVSWTATRCERSFIQNAPQLTGVIDCKAHHLTWTMSYFAASSKTAQLILLTPIHSGLSRTKATDTQRWSGRNASHSCFILHTNRLPNSATGAMITQREGLQSMHSRSTRFIPMAGKL